MQAHRNQEPSVRHFTDRHTRVTYDEVVVGTRRTGLIYLRHMPDGTPCIAGCEELTSAPRGGKCVARGPASFIRKVFEHGRRHRSVAAMLAYYEREK
jgi:hypothetical protein